MLLSLVQHFAVAAILAAIIGAICRAYRLAPATKHALWLVVLVKLAMPPVLVVRTPWTWNALPAPQPFTQNSPGDMALPETPALMTRASIAGPDAQSPRLPPGDEREVVQPQYSVAHIAMVIWLTGATLYLLLQLVRIVRLERCRGRGVPAEPGLAARVNALAGRAHLSAIPIRVVPELDSPLIWSIRRPVLLWPAQLPADLPDACLDGLILHELAHVRRRDHWVSWIELAAGALNWWNPLFWYVRAEVREHAELACDAYVVASLPQGRRAYAEALVAVCQVAARREVPVPAIGVSTGSRRVLERRLIMIMRGQNAVHLSRAASVATLVLVAATVPVWAQRATPPSTRPPAMPVEVAPRPRTPVAPVEVTPEPTRGAAAPPAVVAAEPMQRAGQALPLDAQRLIVQFEDDQAQVQREADARISRQRTDVIRQLESLQDSYSKAGRLDDAIAIRDRIRLLQSGVRADVSVVSRPPMPAPVPRRGNTETTTTTKRYLETMTSTIPDSLTTYRDRIGSTVSLTVTGRTDGSVWGSGIYTDDSSLSTAAVHAGVLRPGETKTVTVRILDGLDHYDGSRQNGVRTQEYGVWEGSYRIESASAPTGPAIPSEPRTVSRTTPVARSEADSVNLTQFRDHVWESFTVTVTGSTSGSVWGSDIYTDDSSISTAAVHAGLLKPGERGTLKVTLLPGQTRYAGATRNGVESMEYGSWEGSFRLERAK